MRVALSSPSSKKETFLQMICDASKLKEVSKYFEVGKAPSEVKDIVGPCSTSSSAPSVVRHSLSCVSFLYLGHSFCF
jgi:hypothetical protein